MSVFFCRETVWRGAEMVNWKDCIVPYGKRKTVPPPPFPLPKKWIPVKCSTCGNRKCRERFAAVEWRHCGEWVPEVKGDG